VNGYGSLEDTPASAQLHFPQSPGMQMMALWDFFARKRPGKRE